MPAIGEGGTVETFGGEMVMVDCAVSETVWILGRTRAGVLEEVGAEARPLGEKV